MLQIPSLPADYLVTANYFSFYCAFSRLMLIQKLLTAERSLSEREFLSLENAEKQHLVQTAEGQGGKSQLVLRQESSLLKHPGEPQACILEKTMERDSSLFSFSSYH